MSSGYLSLEINCPAMGFPDQRHHETGCDSDRFEALAMIGLSVVEPGSRAHFSSSQQVVAERLDGATVAVLNKGMWRRILWEGVPTHFERRS